MFHKGKLKDLSIRSNYDVHVFLEQAFANLVKDEDGEIVVDENETVETSSEKSVVDIVIAIYKLSGRLKQSKAFDKKELQAIILIENKIKAKPTPTQLEYQFKGARDKLIDLGLDAKEIDNKLFNIYVTPDILIYKNHFEDFQQQNKFVHHLRWHANADVIPTHSITDLIKDLLNKDAKGETDPILEYTRHTLKSFLAFIKNDFKSYIQEEIESQSNGFYYDSLVEAIAAAKGNDSFLKLDERMKNWIEEFIRIINEGSNKFHYHYTVNRVSIEYDGTKIYNLQRHAENKFRIHYMSSSAPFKEIDTPLKPGWYERKNIDVNDNNSIKESIHYLEYSKLNYH